MNVFSKHSAVCGSTSKLEKGKIKMFGCPLLVTAAPTKADTMERLTLELPWKVVGVEVVVINLRAVLPELRCIQVMTQPVGDQSLSLRVSIVMTIWLRPNTSKIHTSVSCNGGVWGNFLNCCTINGHWDKDQK